MTLLLEVSERASERAACGLPPLMPATVGGGITPTPTTHHPPTYSPTHPFYPACSHS